MSSLDDMFAKCVPVANGLLVHPSTGLFLRHKGDLGNILEQRIYWKDLSQFKYEPGDLLLDVGGYIGDSVYHFLKIGGLTKAIAVEPDEDNCRVFKANWGSEPNVKLIQAAVVPEGRDKIKLYKGKNYPSTHSLTEFRGREVEIVDTVSWAELLVQGLKVIKFSAEGAEHLLDWSILPDTVSEVFIFIAQKKPDWFEKSSKIDSTLQSIGFNTVRPPVQDTFGPGKVACWSRRV